MGRATYFLTYLLFFPIFALAANDWSEPCFDGQCSYDVDGPVSGSLLISGASTAISDLTEAAGWSILDCDSNSKGQNLRAVCTNATAGCDHLYQGSAVGTIVRMPKNCTQMPFARVASMWEDENQTTSYSPRSRIYPRITLPAVMGFILDTNFSAVDPSQNGQIAIHFQGASLGGSPADLARRSSDNITKSATQQIPPINVNEQGTLFNDSLNCPSTSITVDGASIDCHIQLAVDIATNVTASYGFSLSGSLVPPELTDFTLNTALDGSLDGTLTINSTGQLTLASPSITLFTIGIPGLDIPGILSIGPTFQIDANAVVTLGADLDATVGVNYTIDNAELNFPPSANATSSGSFTPGANSLHLAVSEPDVQIDTSITVNLIPSIAFGITAFEDVKATVSLDVDAFVTLSLEAQDNAQSSAAPGSSMTYSPSVAYSSSAAYSPSTAYGSSAAYSPSTAYSSSLAYSSSAAYSSTPAYSSSATSSSSTDAQSSGDGFSASVNLVAGVNVTADADANLFGIFDDNKSFTLFSKTFELFQKSFS